MARSTLTWYKSKANRIMRDIKALNRTAVGNEINESHQTVSYRINHMYQEQLEDLIRVLNMAGYEIREKVDD